jgi:Tol biopolymer transport system component
VAPAFTPDGKSVYFTHVDGEKCTIMMSHLHRGGWSDPEVAPFSGQWRDIEPAMAPDGSYLIFISNRPAEEGGKALDGFFGGAVHPGKGGNLWRVDRTEKGWSRPVRLPDIVNSNSAIYSPAVAGNGNLYFNQPDPKTKKTRMYISTFKAGRYSEPEPVSFSDGVISDYDAVIAPNESYIIFSSPRAPTPKGKSGIFIAFRNHQQWGQPVPFEPFLTGIECRLSANRKTLYFTSDRPTLETPVVPEAASGPDAPALPQRIWQIRFKPPQRHA